MEDIVPGFIRVSGDCMCSICGKKYYEHPFDKRYPTDESLWIHKDRPEYILRRLCDGLLVKL